MEKTAKDLVEYAKAQLGLPYWYGTFGLTATAELYAAKKKQYPEMYASWDDFPSQYGKRVHDCVGLIKGYLWSDSATAKPKYNSSQDVSANGMLNACKEKGTINTIPDIAGVLVFMPGHVGIYIGDGYVIEARGHQYGVVKTILSARPWKNWGKCPWIDYSDSAAEEKPAESKTVSVKKMRLKKGTWNVRKLPSADSSVIASATGGKDINVADKWYFIPSLGGWVSEKAFE